MAFKLTPLIGTARFQGKAGDSVVLFTKPTIGTVTIARARYNDAPLAIADGMVTFDIVAGENVLNLVFGVPETGAQGELVEKDGGSTQFIRDVFGHHPAQAIVITGVKQYPVRAMPGV